MLVANLDRCCARRLVGCGGGVSGRGSKNAAICRDPLTRLEPRVLLAQVFWDGGAGTDSWHDALNWSGDELPTAADDVVIEESEVSPIRMTAFGTTAVRSLATAVDMVVRGGLTVSEGVVLNARMQVGNDGWGTLSFGGPLPQVLGGAGEVVLGQQGTSSVGWIVGGSDATLTIGNGIIVRGAGEVRTNESDLVIEGTIRADEPGRYLAITVAGTLVNRGRLEAPAGDLIVWGSTVDLNIGELSGIGGRLWLGGVVNNHGRTIELDASTGDIYLGGEIHGGTVSSSDGRQLIVETPGGGNFYAGLVGLRLTGSVTVRGGGELRIRDGLVLDGTITLGDGGFGFGGTYSGWGKLNFWTASPVQTLSGSGEIVFNHSAARIRDATTSVVVSFGVSLTIGGGITFRGGGGDIRVMANASLVSDAAVHADIANKAVALHATAATSILVSRGRLEATAGLLVIGGYSGIAVVAIRGAGSITNSGGAVHIAGRLDLADHTLVIEGEASIGATIIGGTILAAPAGGLLTFWSSYQYEPFATLRGVTLEIPVQLTRSGTLNIEDGLRLDSTITVGGLGQANQGGNVEFRTTSVQSVTGSGEIVFVTGAAVRAIGVALDVGSDITIRGGNGLISALSGGSITNFGTIAATVAGTTILLQGNIVHHGVMRIAAGATIARTGSFVLQPGALLHIEVAGTAASQIGRLTATGALTVGGAIEVVYVEGFVPVRGQSFRLVTSVGASGAFASVATPALPNPDLKSPVLVDPLGVRLIVTHIADFNNDLAVNEADIFAFLNSWFAGGGDFDGDGVRTVTDIFVFLSAWYRA